MWWSDAIFGTLPPTGLKNESNSTRLAALMTINGSLDDGQTTAGVGISIHACSIGRVPVLRSRRREAMAHAAAIALSVNQSQSLASRMHGRESPAKMPLVVSWKERRSKLSESPFIHSSKHNAATDIKPGTTAEWR